MMDDNTRRQQVHLRMEASRRLLHEVNVNMEFEFWNSIMNRMYYACFYAVQGALMSVGVDHVKRHEGARSMFNLHFVANGKIDKKWGRFFAHMFEYRSQADYDFETSYTRQQIEELHPLVEDFVNLLIGIAEGENDKSA